MTKAGRSTWLAWLAALLLGLGGFALAAERGAKPVETPVERGQRLMLTKAYLPADFDSEVFDELWKAWPEPWYSRAVDATPAERREIAFERYGLSELPESLGGPRATALQYADDGHGGWVMTCLVCHTGTVAGRVVLGAPNSLYDLQTLTEEVRDTKLRLGKEWAHMDTASLVYPLSGSIGTTNAVMFGKILTSHRDEDLHLVQRFFPPALLHHDCDAPAWWNLKRKKYLYADGFVPKGHRALMQFLLIPQNGPRAFDRWDKDYADILAWIESLEPPKYAGRVDAALAGQGRLVFEQHCAECHGTYGADGEYPERIVPIAEVGTDRARLDALSVEGRAWYGRSWFGRLDTLPTVADPGGYVAPPLDGIWASAPYLHNGAVPTLWHMLHPSDRPIVWQRTIDGYDHERMGLEVTELEAIPATVHDPRDRRRYFDTHLLGKSAAGHTFPDVLDETQKRAVLEYLKTL